jgi:hypothetical protein
MKDLHEKTLVELREIAKALGLKGITKYKKDELEELILKNRPDHDAKLCPEAKSGKKEEFSEGSTSEVALKERPQEEVQEDKNPPRKNSAPTIRGSRGESLKFCKTGSVFCEGKIICPAPMIFIFPRSRSAGSI